MLLVALSTIVNTQQFNKTLKHLKLYGIILEQMLQLTIATNVISKVILTQLNEALNVQIVATVQGKVIQPYTCLYWPVEALYAIY